MSSYIATIVFDTSIFILAVWKMGKLHSAIQTYGLQSSVTSILLRDGSLLYAVLAVSNITNFAIFMAFRSVDGIWDTDFLFVTSSGTNNEMTHALSTILVSRMIFNLREVGTEVYEGTMEWRSRLERISAHESIVFRSRSRREIEIESGADTFDLS
ncbi:hypothetical protein SCHPADRAFT_225156 [Schizopora paradoxa]|uniref:Uncharacterized protein n=1 Tax=Schizopora paradoxa TaxID=27342 RepID=A0A0H2SGJ3_9AGAM|nr:hypothetical protein SCHPADRAFT_225156 [Schizopora paradoxa]